MDTTNNITFLCQQTLYQEYCDAGRFGAMTSPQSTKNLGVKISRPKLVLGNVYPNLFMCISTIHPCFLRSLNGPYRSFKFHSPMGFIYVENKDHIDLSHEDVEKFVSEFYSVPIDIRLTSNIHELTPQCVAQHLLREESVLKEQIERTTSLGHEEVDLLSSIIQSIKLGKDEKNKKKIINNFYALTKKNKKEKKNFNKKDDLPPGKWTAQIGELANFSETWSSQIGLPSISKLCGFSDSVEELQKVIESAGEVAEDIVWKFSICTLVLGIFLIGVAKKQKNVIIIGSIALPLVLASVLPQRHIDRFKDIFNVENVFEAQSGIGGIVDPPSGIVTGAVSIIFLAFQHIVFGKEKVKFTASAFAGLLSSFPKVHSGISEIVLWFKEVFISVANYIECALTGKTHGHLFGNPNYELDKLLDDVETFNTAYRKGELLLNYSNAMRLTTMQQELRGMLRTLPMTNKVVAVRSLINSTLHLLEQIEGPFRSASLIGNGTRMRPLVVFLNGGSGSGKTTLIVPFIQQLVVDTIPSDQRKAAVEHIDDYIYAREVMNKYWDGYRGQFCCVFDDFGQTKDVPGAGDNEYTDMIYCSSSFPHPLHVANIGEKGRNFFHSELMILTSNLKNFSQVQSINCVEALERRMDVRATVAPKAQYCTDDTKDSSDPWIRRLDISKIKSGKEFDSDIYEFHLFDFTSHGTNHNWTVKYTGKVIDYDEMISMCVQKYCDRKEQSSSFANEMQERRNNMVSNSERYPNLRPSIPDRFHSVKTQTQLYKLLLEMKEVKGVSDLAFKRIDALFVSIDNPKQTYLYNECMKLANALPTEYEAEINLGDTLGAVGSSFRNFSAAMSSNTDMPNGDSLYEEITGNGPNILVDSDEEDDEEDVNLNVWPPANHEVHVQLLQQSLVKFGLCIEVEEFVRFVEPIIEIRWCNDMDDVVEQALDIWPSLSNYDEHLKCDHFCCKCKVRYMSLSYKSKYLKFLELRRGYKADIQGKINDFFVKYPRFKTFVLGVVQMFKYALIGVTAYGAYTLFNDNFGPNSGVDKKSQRSLFRPDDFGAEGGYDKGLEDIMFKILNANQYSIYMNDAKAGYATFVKDRFAIMPWHFVDGAIAACNGDHTQTFELRSVNGKFTYEIEYDIIINHSKRIGLCDIAVVEFPRKMRCHQNILHFFQSIPSMDVRKNYDVMLMIMDDDGLRRYSSPGKYVGDRKINAFNKAQDAHNCMEYKAKTKFGDCGSIVALEDKSVQKEKIVGFHIAGMSDGKALCNILPRKAIEDMIGQFDAVDFEFQEDLTPTAQMDGPFVTYGEVQKGVRLPIKSRIIPGLLHGRLGPIKTAPAILVKSIFNGVSISPMKKGLLRYSGPTFHVPEHVLRMLGDTLYASLYNNSSTNIPAEVYSFEESVLGRPGEKYFDAIPRNTSAGYPFNVDIPPHRKGKTWFFGDKQDYDLDNANCRALKKRCAEIISKAKEGVRLHHYFADYLKDERRPLEKVRQLKTRLIFASPVDYLIVARQYFTAFARWIMVNRINNGVAVGINAYQEWDLLARHLLAHSNNFIAGDFSGFDGSEVSEILWVVYDIIEKWYSSHGGLEEHTKVRKVLWYEVVNSFHVSGKTIYEWTRSLPSGHPLTTIINSLYCQSAFRLAWYEHNGQSLSSFRTFDENVKLVSYGDDSIGNVSSDCPGFNQNTIPEYMSRYGLTWTHETKIDGDFPDYRDITQLDFLKRSFRFEESVGQWLAPLSLDSVIEPCCWTKEGPYEITTQRSNISNAFRELPLHGREVFDEYASKLISLSQEHLEYVPDVTDFRNSLHLTMNSELTYNH